MHTVSYKQVGISSSCDEPIYEIVVKNQRGKILHIDNCYECDLDRYIDEINTGEPWE